MPGFVFRFCACVLLALPLLGQQTSIDPAVLIDGLTKQMTPVASAWLNGADARLQAWGAYLTLRDRSMEATPVLLAKLAVFQPVEQRTSQAETDRHDAMLAILDAIIQLGVQAPVEDAERIYPEFPVQSLLLLARSKQDAAPALLSIFKGKRGESAAWLAAGNLLLDRTAKGFASAVIEDMTVHVEVSIVDPGAPGVRMGIASCCGAGFLPKLKAGWPPVGVYEFGGCADSMASGDTVLAGGTDAASYRRQVNTTYVGGSASTCGCNIDRDLVSQHYLTRLARGSQDRPLVRAHVNHNIVWQGPDAYRSDLAAFIDKQQSNFADLARRLGGIGLLSGDEVKSLRPALHIAISDQRAAKEPVLPGLGPLAANVSIEPL
jgi:hypothetical protein